MTSALPTPPEKGRKPAQIALCVLVLAIAIVFLFRTYSPQFSTRPTLIELPAGRLDLNRADRVELCQVPGVGEQIADKILAYRASVGRIDNVDDLKQIPGIGVKTFDKLRPWFTVEAEQNGTSKVTHDDVERLERKSKPIATNSSATPYSVNAAKQLKLKPGDPPIDINSATLEDLLRVPYIGPTLAANIIAARGEGYKSLAEIGSGRVPGIRTKTFEKISPYLSVGSGK